MKSREEKKWNEEHQWLAQQIKKYKAVLPKYSEYSSFLEKVLNDAIRKYAPLSIVQVRTKTISSFADKCLRKKTAHNNPVNEFTDLCGARIITTTTSEVKTLCRFIEKHYDIDWENSIDITKRHRPTEFGYRSIHYIVSFKKGIFPTKEVCISIPQNICPSKKCPMKAEIQVRTLLEHAWAVYSHDRTYKGSFKIPDKWERELAAVAAALEAADNSFERIQTGLKVYASSYDVYMSENQRRKEILRLEFIYPHDPADVTLATRIAQLAISVGDWQRVVKILSKFGKSGYQPALKALGFALCKIYENKPKDKHYRQGQKYLEKAVELDETDTDAIASLAGTFKGIDDDRSMELYRRAFAIDPTDSYPLGNYLTYEISQHKNISIIQAVSPVIYSSIKRCKEQIDVGINIPWAYYSMGKFSLLLGKPYESLLSYARAVQLSTDAFMIETSLESLKKLLPVKKELIGYEWIRLLLLLGLASIFSSKEAINDIKKLKQRRYSRINGSVIIVAGGCDAKVEEKMKSYKGILLEAFKDFNGTIISGGTTQGICGLVGDIRKHYGDSIHTIGYLPRMVPADATADKDPLRYKEIRYTEGDNFSPLEPLQNWIDLLASDILPANVKVLGIDGGTVAAAEYRIALALGAQVAILEESGREASRLLSDPQWMHSENLFPMPADPQTVRAFIDSVKPDFDNTKRTIMAKAFHEYYRRIHTEETLEKQSSFAKWEKLSPGFKESNLQAAEHIIKKLREIGCIVQEVKNRAITPFKFSKNEIELLSEMEHGRWNAERIKDGWKWGEEKDVLKKISPFLVSWAQLPEKIKQWDRDMVCSIPQFSADVGLEIRRQKPKKRGK